MNGLGWGGENAAGEKGGGGGRYSSGPNEGVGVIENQISVPNDQRNLEQVQDKDSGGTSSLKKHPSKL